MIRESQKRAKKKWSEENIYKTTVTFYKKDFPKEDYEKVKKQLKREGISMNRFLSNKLKELAGGK